MKNMASALFGVLATVGGVPIIRALPGGPTQMISEQLSKVRPERRLCVSSVVVLPYANGVVVLFSVRRKIR